MPELKLKIELVPSTSWFSNLRNMMGRKDWDVLRKSTYAKYNHQCGICDDKPKILNCHELWEYDDDKHIQYLKGFIALCPMCHHVKHIGFAGILANDGLLNFDDVVNHFIRINKCTMQAYDKHYDEAFSLWEKRSRHDWDIDLGEYKKYIRQH
jgi:hypothetical protein